MTQYSQANLNKGELVRDEVPPTGFNCYNAVVYWAFQAGAISLRWIWNEWQGTGEERVAKLYPKGMEDWPPSRLANNEYPIEAGRTVIFQRSPDDPGHTVLSIGNGRCISHNWLYLLQGVKDPNEEPAWTNMASGKTHTISLRALQEGHYQYLPGREGSYSLRASVGTFWEYYPLESR